MLDRRQLLMSGTAVATMMATSQAVWAASSGASAASKKLDALFDQFVDEQLDHSPEGVTALGLDVGARAHQRSEMSDRSLAEVAKVQAMVANELSELKALDRSALAPRDAIGYDVVLYDLETEVAADRRYKYAGGRLQAPYVVSQLTGSYQRVPDFLDSVHPINDKADADAYIARLNAFPKMVVQEIERMKHDIALGVVPPDFILKTTLTQMNRFREQTAGENILSASIARRAEAKNLGPHYGGDAARIVWSKVYPALDAQIALLESLQPKAVHDAGVWRLPDGEAYYADSLAQSTTTKMSPAEVHKLGLDVNAQLASQADAIMKKHGLTKGSVGQRMRAMYADPKFRYPNNDAGKEKLIADLNKKVQAVRAKLPQYFGVLPKANVVIARVPKYIEAGAPGGYYENPSLDGKRPGRYYINLRDTAEVPSWTLPTLTFHEAIPGHHLQGAIQQEANLPLIRKLADFTAYIEGWALYSEQLAVEMGMYADDPFGQIGQLHDAMLRGVRLVVDSGLHAMKWSREQGIKYYVDMIGDPETIATSEVERYSVWPGQACAYMVGKLTFLRLRDKAKAALGSRFNLRDFHDAVLLCGAVPLSVLEQVIDGYIASKQGNATPETMKR